MSGQKYLPSTQNYFSFAKLVIQVFTLISIKLARFKVIGKRCKMLQGKLETE